MIGHIPFQSTLLVRGATFYNAYIIAITCISIHAPRERSDGFYYGHLSKISVFQSTLLVRGATNRVLILSVKSVFQSTLLVRGATKICACLFFSCFISIHAPRERSDCGINKKYPQPVFILHKYWIFSDIFQRFWQRKTSFYFFFHCKFYVYLAFAQNIISSQGK